MNSPPPIPALYLAQAFSYQTRTHEKCIYSDDLAEWLDRSMKSTLRVSISIVSSVYFTHAIRMENAASSFNKRGFSLTYGRSGR